MTEPLTFTADDFREAAGAIERAIDLDAYAAAASNRHNIILAALRAAAAGEEKCQCDRVTALTEALDVEQRLRAELYQVLGSLADFANVFEHPDVIRALDNASRGLVHDDLLPWPRTSLGAKP